MLQIARRSMGGCCAAKNPNRWIGSLTSNETDSKRRSFVVVSDCRQNFFAFPPTAISPSRRRFSVRPRRLQQSTECQTTEDAKPVAVDCASHAGKKRPDPQKTSLEHVLFQLARSEDSTVPTALLFRTFKNAGLWRSDPRLAETIRKLNGFLAAAREDDRREVHLDEDQFVESIGSCPELAKRAFTGDLVIPEFSRFTKTIDEIYAECRSNGDGLVASYIPQLSRYSPDFWGVSVCTVDGQRHAIGDVGVPFTVQSSGKPINYALALNELGPDFVHRYIGHEPSGETFNCIKLNSENKPHNPMINAGAIVVSSLIRRDLSPADRFDYITGQYRRVVGGEFLGFNNAVFLSEKETADRNFAIGYCLQENGCFPDGAALASTMDLYFQLCSIEINANSGAVIAATLANGGKCPTTGDEILGPDAVRNTLALMQSCGMYDYSGGFAFKVGIPAKSSVSGAILVVVPNVAGLCLWSPPLDRAGNSVRGVQFCEQLVKRFQFHPYDSFRGMSVVRSGKNDPRTRKSDAEANQVADLLFGACAGDLTALRRLALAKQDMTVSADYDGRTALHLACAEGHLDCVRFLVEECKVPVNVIDRWGRTPMNDAVRFQRHAVQDFLTSLQNVDRYEKQS